MSLSKEEQTLITILTKSKITFNAPKTFKVGDQGRKMYYTALIPNIVVEKNKETPKSLLIRVEDKLLDKREETLKDHKVVMKETLAYAIENNYCFLCLSYTDNEARVSEVVSDMLQLIHKGDEKGTIIRVSSESLATTLGLTEKSILTTKQQPKKTVTIVENNNKDICLENDPIPPIIPIAQEPEISINPSEKPISAPTESTTTTAAAVVPPAKSTCIVS